MLCHAQDELTAVRHRIPGVDRQIEQRHFKLVRVSLGGWEIASDIKADLDRGPQRRAEQPGHALDQPRHVDRHRLQRLAAGKGQQALDQRLGALGRLQRAVDQPLLAFVTHAPSHQHVE